MSKTDAAQRIADLVAKLHQYNHEYHVLARPSVSDREYDTLFDAYLETRRQMSGVWQLQAAMREDLS